ncbi:cupin domain-containing protein [Hahella aquimaris]|uniref:cupin domain-containing protein n=1 Tax=Hahella sp. HNIBRBA332 TaxID=3015983 RepID=UPI00273B623A|nr:cupin domain-containing protein [Hahella sp. HNIBRBA332]WLQ11283.1 cupin domain-containing protein [Hahella sp. HNIBRBA332]
MTMDASPSIQQLVDQLKLSPHPEGGFYRRIFAAPYLVSTPYGERPSATLIYYLLPRGGFSQWHRLRNDEIWLHLGGDCIHIYTIAPDGALSTQTIGSGLSRDAHAPGMTWLAAEPEPGSAGYTLVSCIVSPGFDFADFELGDADELTPLYPKHFDLILRLSRSGSQGG